MCSPLGRLAREKVVESRRRVAKLLGTDDEDEILFTSGGTEVRSGENDKFRLFSISFTFQSNHLAMHSAIESYMTRQQQNRTNGSSSSSNGHVNGGNDVIPHVVTTNIEHPATELPLRQWEQEGRIGDFK
jgi:cysteine sulfinate desulfinase/cysteine desulfurase-like protein